MQIRSAPTPPRPAPPPPPALPEAVQHGRDVVDTIKRRSALVATLQPLSMGVGLAAHPLQTLESLESIGRAFWHGNLASAKQQITDFAYHTVHPTGVGKYAYTAGLAIGAAADGFTGSVELYWAAKNHDSYLGMMGGADILGGISSAVMTGGHPLLALGICVASATAKTTLVLSKPQEFSRIQKARTLFDAGDAVSLAMVRAGLAVVPVLALNALIGPTEVLYLNHDGFRHKVDQAIDWLSGNKVG